MKATLVTKILDSARKSNETWYSVSSQLTWIENCSRTTKAWANSVQFTRNWMPAIDVWCLLQHMLSNHGQQKELTCNNLKEWVQRIANNQILGIEKSYKKN